MHKISLLKLRNVIAPYGCSQKFTLFGEKLNQIHLIIVLRKLETQDYPYTPCSNLNKGS